MNKGEQAVEYYNKNFNCSQGVFTVFAKEQGIDEELALKISTYFGGGARKGELCGAVAGALMALGLFYGHSDGKNQEEKSKAYSIAEEFMDRFIAAKGTVVCRELLGYDLTKPEERAQILEKDLFHCICPEMIRCSATIVDEMIREKNTDCGLKDFY